MFAIGFLSLLSFGFVAMAFDGEDDPVGLEQNDDDQDILTLDQNQGEDLLSFFDPGSIPLEEPDSEEIQRINAFIAELEANPSDDMAERFEDFITQLEAERLAEEEELAALGDEIEVPEEVEEPAEDLLDQGGTEDTPEGEEVESTEDAVARPPMGDAYRDPLILAEEMESFRTPEALVTVSGSDGEIPDEQVLSQNQAGSSSSHSVSAPDEPHSITVGYDSQYTFEIAYSHDTATIDAGLNSTLEGPEGNPVLSKSTTVDDDGNYITEEAYKLNFAGSTEINLNITAEQLGSHVAQISLINPADSLDFNFDQDVTGNFHLFFHESETGEEGDTSTMLRAFVVQTATSQTALSASDIADIVEAGMERTATVNVVAEIYLGSDALVAGLDTGAGEDTVIHDFTNSDPRIGSNINWASVSHHDEDSANPEGTTSPNTDQGDDFGDLFDGIGLNPTFFGI